MYCPTCGAQNSDTSKFCRKCGMNIQVVSQAVYGQLNQPTPPPSYHEICGPARERHKHKALTMEESISKLSLGAAFLVAVIILSTLGRIGVWEWAFWLLIPAFILLGKGIAGVLCHYKRQPQHTLSFQQPSVQDNNTNELPPPDYTINAPDSVTAGTTRHMDPVGKPQSNT